MILDNLSIWIPVIVAIIAALPGYIGTFKGHGSRRYIHQALIRNDLFEMLQIARANGCRTEAMCIHFNEIWNLYKKMGGNSYGEEIKSDWEGIPKEYERE